MKEKIKFHNNNASDPDFIIQQCYLLIIAGASEIGSGIENLWKSRPSVG